MSAFASPGNNDRAVSFTFTVVWAILVTFLVLFAVLRAIFSCIKKAWFDDTRNQSSLDMTLRHTPVDRHESTSTERQEEIYNLRKNALLRYMSKYTMTLGDEHLLCCYGSNSSQFDTTVSAKSQDIIIDDGSVSKDGVCQDIEQINDIETGNMDVVEERRISAPDVKYTHIVLPLPGCDIAGVDVAKDKAHMEDAKEAMKWRLPSLFWTGDDNAAKREEEVSVSATSTTDANLHQQQGAKKRRVPIFCAICLTEYQKCERVCWSSNAECSHVFHEDCILQWLLTSGRKRPMNQFFDKHPPDEKLLEDEFCPCCRQDFISVKPEVLRGSKESV